MKHPILALAAAAAMVAATGAQAQTASNVSIYGLVDAGLEYTSNANAAKDSVTRVTSGGMNTSRWGFRGTEDLGGGLKAVFGLEGGILMDTGAQDGALFKRQAYVGLEGSYGRLVMGRSFTSVYDTVISFDPMGFAPYYSWATSGPATGPSKYGFTTVGPHKADIRFLLNGQDAAEQLSRGQLKLLICMLKVVQSQLLREMTGIRCLFLLDDLPAELDADNRAKVCQLLGGLQNQCFLTSIEQESLAPIALKQAESSGMPLALFHVKHGKIVAL